MSQVMTPYAPYLPEENAVTGPLSPAAALRRREEWTRVVKRIRELGGLGDDWDGQGASPPRRENVNAAMRWAILAMDQPKAVPPTYVAPGTMGEITVEWESESCYLELEFREPMRAETMWERRGLPTVHETIDDPSGWYVQEE